MSGPTCVCCGGDQIGNEPLCALCWNQVPIKYRNLVYKAQKALGCNPASARVLAEFRQALADACGAIA